MRLMLAVRYIAYDLVRSFAHLGGAILAVDVESWDQNNDVSWTVLGYSMIKADSGAVYHRGWLGQGRMATKERDPTMVQVGASQ